MRLSAHTCIALASPGSPARPGTAQRLKRLGLALLGLVGLHGAMAQGSGQPGVAMATPIWSVAIGGPLNLAPLIADKRVYVVPQNGALQALDLDSGKVLWTRPQADVWDRGLSYHDGRLVVCLSNAHVAALDPATGRELWRTSLQGIQCQRPAAHQGRNLLVSTTWVGNGMQAQPDRRAKLYNIDLHTGRVKWAFESDTFLLQTATSDADQVFVGGSFLDPSYTAEEGGSAYYYALRMTDGAAQWRHLSRDGLPKTLYAQGGALTYVAYEDFVRGLNARTGEPLWSKDTENWVSALTGDGRTLYLGSANRAIHAWDAVSGTVRWRYNMPGASFDYMLVRPTVHGSVLWYATQTGRIFALSKDQGQRLWEAQTQRTSRIDPAFADARMVIGDIDGQLSAFALPQQLWDR